jgi:hypothetical protein
MQHLYEGYKNLIERVLEIKSRELKASGKHDGSSTPRSMSLSGLINSPRGAVLAPSASTRFERLGDRIKLLILSETEEFLAEKEALINTVANPSLIILNTRANQAHSISILTRKKTQRPRRG